MEKKKKNTKVEEDNECEHLKTLGRKLLPDSFNRILAAQIDVQLKNKRGRRYNSELKKFALSLYFLSPRNYRELKKSIATPSVRSLQLFTETCTIVPNINDKIFQAFKFKLNTLAVLEFYCIVYYMQMK